MTDLRSFTAKANARLADGLTIAPGIGEMDFLRRAGRIVRAESDATRLVVPQLFAAQAATIEWQQLVGQDKVRQAQLAAAGPDLLQRGVHLRWMVAGYCGMPTEPFAVWQRRTHYEDYALLDPPAGFGFDDGIATVLFSKPLARLALYVETGPDGAAISPMRGTPLLSGVEMPLFVAPGPAQLVVVSSSYMVGVALAGVTNILGAAGITVDRYATELDWELVETVGLPVKKSKWSAIGDWAANQGLAGSLQSPRDAAQARLRRGGPPFGWRSRLPSGPEAPLWTAPAPLKLLDELDHAESGILDRLREAMKLPPELQAGFKQEVDMPPQQVSGLQVPKGTGSVFPLGIAQIAGSTDPFLALALGFGTALPLPETEAAFAPLIDSVAVRHWQLDFLVTALWREGLSGQGSAFELAACLPAPGPAFNAPEPANLSAKCEGLQPPSAPDKAWWASVRLQWDCLPRNAIVQVASFGACRAGSLSMSPLLEQRPSGGWRPIAATPGINSDGSVPTTLQAVDPEVSCLTGTVKQEHAVTQQTLFGLWSHWSETSVEITAPAAQVPVIVSGNLVSAPGPAHADPCPTELIVEIVYDWTVRRPDRIELVGRLFKAPLKSTPPPDPSIAPGLQRSIGVDGAKLVIHFDAEHPDAAGATVTPISANDGTPVNEAFGMVRRYRVAIPGLSLDYGAGHVGMILFARAIEIVGGTSNWSPVYRILASDPRPPEPKPLPSPRLASLPDAAGECHVRLHWLPSDGAAGYFIYEATETAILAASGKSGVSPHTTLQERLITLRETYDGKPSRTIFTRRTPKPVTGTSIDLTLPRGSTVYHAFVICAHSAGQIESAWPATHDGVQFVVAPRVMIPAPPRLELRREGQSVRVFLTAREGPRVASFDLFRTRLPDAARRIDLMGPPAAAVTVASEPEWTLAKLEEESGTWLVEANGLDFPAPSWRLYWYRAQAWTADHDPLGWRRGRSASSASMSILVPPETPPAVEALSAAPGGGLDMVQLKWKSAAPAAPTPIGPHRIEIELGPGLANVNTTLDRLDKAAGLARDGVDFTYGFKRDATKDIRAIVRIVDPLGRAGESDLLIPAGKLVQPVMLIGPTGAFLNDGSVLTPYDLVVQPTQPPLSPKPKLGLLARIIRAILRFFGLERG